MTTKEEKKVLEEITEKVSTITEKLEEQEAPDEVTEEVTEEATKETPEGSIQIVEGTTKDGRTVRGITENGKNLFFVSETFTNEQIEEVFGLVNQFYGDGVKFIQGQFHKLIGITVLPPTNIEKESTEKES